MQRLKTRGQFQAVLAGGIVARTAHFAMHRASFEVTGTEFKGTGFPAQPLAAQSAPWVGAMVPKRLAKRAVTRNAIKRQIFSIGTDFKSTLPVAAHVVRLRAGFDKRQFLSAVSEQLKLAVRNELQQLFASAELPMSSTVSGAE